MFQVTLDRRVTRPNAFPMESQAMLMHHPRDLNEGREIEELRTSAQLLTIRVKNEVYSDNQSNIEFGKFLGIYWDLSWVMH